MPIAYVNGTFVPLADAKVSVTDRGFLFADGIYEVFACYAGELFCADAHFDRLERSLDEVGIDNPCSRAEWLEILSELIERNDISDAGVYLQVTRGAEPQRNLLPGKQTRPTIVAFLCPMKIADESVERDGVKAVTLPDERWGRCDIKSVALLPNVLAQMKASEAGAHEAILLRDGNLTEGASSNVFVTIEGTVVTPRKSHRLLPGITRDVVVRLLRDLGIAQQERDVDEQALRSAEEIWITSSTREIFPVTQLDDRPVGDGKPGPLWRQAFDAIQRARTTE